MRDLRRILVPVDFSDCSDSAFEYAVGFARAAGAEVEALHVWVAPSYVSPTLAVQIAKTGDMTTLEALARRDADERMRAMLQQYPHEGVRVSTRVLGGDPLQTILELSLAFDLIIAGTHGRTGVSHLFLGSIAEKIARAADRPVLIVRCANSATHATHATHAGHPLARPKTGSRGDHRTPVRRIMAAVDFSSCARVALEDAVALAARFGATLEIFHAVTHVPIEGAELMVTGYSGDTKTPFKEWAKKRAEQEMQALIAQVPGAERGEVIMELGDPASAILEAAKRSECDLLVIGTHGRGGVTRLLLGSIAERVIRKSPCPVLSVRAPK